MVRRESRTKSQKQAEKDYKLVPVPSRLVTMIKRIIRWHERTLPAASAAKEAMK